MYSVLRNGDKVLGYTLVMPLRKSAYEAIKNGRMWEAEIFVRDIDDTHPEGFYLASIASARSVKNRLPFITGILCGIAGGQVEKASLEVMAIPVTRAGQKLAKMLKMEENKIDLNIQGVDGFIPKVYIKPPFQRTPLNIGN